MKTAFAWLTFPLVALACGAPPPAAADAALLGVRISIEGDFGLSKTSAEQVYFARVGESGDLSVATLIPSNYATDGYVFLLNAVPGTYAAVVAASSTESDATVYDGQAAPAAGPHELDELTYLPELVVSHTVIRVEPGTAAFMGDYVLGRELFFDAADETQLHYYRLLQPGEASGGLVGALLEDRISYCGTLSAEDRGPTALGRFIDRAGRRIGEDGWSSALAHPVQPSLR